MPTYIILVRFTQKGMENIVDSPMRLEAARKLGKSFRGRNNSSLLHYGSIRYGCDNGGSK